MSRHIREHGMLRDNKTTRKDYVLLFDNDRFKGRPKLIVLKNKVKGDMLFVAPVIKEFTKKKGWYYCDYDNERIGYYQDLDELRTVVNNYMTLTYGVCLEEEDIRVEL